MLRRNFRSSTCRSQRDPEGQGRGDGQVQAEAAGGADADGHILDEGVGEILEPARFRAPFAS